MRKISDQHEIRIEEQEGGELGLCSRAVSSMYLMVRLQDRKM